MIRTATGYALAAGAWAAHLALYPTFLAWTLAMTPGAHAWADMIDALNEDDDR